MRTENNFFYQPQAVWKEKKDFFMNLSFELFHVLISSGNRSVSFSYVQLEALETTLANK